MKLFPHSRGSSLSYAEKKSINAGVGTGLNILSLLYVQSWTQFYSILHCCSCENAGQFWKFGRSLRISNLLIVAFKLRNFPTRYSESLISKTVRKTTTNFGYIDVCMLPPCPFRFENILPQKQKNREIYRQTCRLIGRPATESSLICSPLLWLSTPGGIFPIFIRPPSLDRFYWNKKMTTKFEVDRIKEKTPQALYSSYGKIQRMF